MLNIGLLRHYYEFEGFSLSPSLWADAQFNIKLARYDAAGNCDQRRSRNNVKFGIQREEYSTVHVGIVKDKRLCMVSL